MHEGGWGGGARDDMTDNEGVKKSENIEDGGGYWGDGRRGGGGDLVGRCSGGELTCER